MSHTLAEDMFKIRITHLGREFSLNNGVISANIKSVRSDGSKFISALVLTLLLSALVIFSGYTRDRCQAMRSRVDLKRIQSLVEEGQLSFQEAGFYEVIEDAPR